MTTTTVYDDPRYWGHAPTGEHLSNYSRVGGFRAEVGRPDLLARWVFDVVGAAQSRPPVKVLEVGCAAGDAVLEMRRLGLDAYGVDVSQYILGRAAPAVREYLARADLLRMLDNAFIVHHAPFEIIVSKDVLEHVEYRSIHFVLADLARLSRRQAHIVNTGQHEYQAWEGDTTHRIRESLEWWRRTGQALGIAAHFEET